LGLSIGQKDCANMAPMQSELAQQTATPKHFVIGMRSETDHAIQAVKAEWGSTVEFRLVNSIKHG
jgi:hypothetical protein